MKPLRTAVIASGLILSLVLISTAAAQSVAGSSLSPPSITVVRPLHAAPHYRPVKCTTTSIDYPPAAVRAEVTGTTGVELKLDTAGRVVDGRISKASGPLIENVLLDRAALAALKLCTGAPTDDTRPTEVWTPVEYVWRLDEDPPTREATERTQADAERGDARAQFRLAEWLRLGLVGAVDLQAANAWLRRSAEGGLAEAQYRLGDLLSQKDPAQAVDWLQHAANQGHRQALYALAHAYAVGLGVGRSDERAHALRLAAAGKGVVDVYNTLAWDFRKGRGTARDDLQAFEWMRKAAGIGYGNALLELGSAYEEGWNGVPDKSKATAMYLIAQRAGDSRAEAELRRMRRLISIEEWDAATRVASAWSPGQGSLPW